MQAKFGAETGTWLWRICRGIDDSEGTFPAISHTFPPILTNHTQSVHVINSSQ